MGQEIRRAVSFNLICPEANDWNPALVKEPYGKRKFDQTLKIDTAGGPDAKIQGDRDLRGYPMPDLISTGSRAKT